MTTISETIKKAVANQWQGTPYAPTVESMAWHIDNFMKARYKITSYPGSIQMGSITEQDVEDFKLHKRLNGCTNSTINKYLSCLSVLFDVAGVPKPTIRRLPEAKVEKWFLPEEKIGELMEFLQRRSETLGGRHGPFKDYIGTLIYTGMRPKEALALQARHLSFISGAITIPGTKTSSSEATIPMFDEAEPYLHNSRCRPDKGTLFGLTYEEVAAMWNEVRYHMGWDTIPTATLKALRRTFADIATKRGMPSAVLQRVLRHSSIRTTEGYLQLTGSGLVEESRKYMNKREDTSYLVERFKQARKEADEEADKFEGFKMEAGRGDLFPIIGRKREAKELALVVAPTGNTQFEGQQLAASIRAYTETGATPEDVAAYTRALLGIKE